MRLAIILVAIVGAGAPAAAQGVDLGTEIVIVPAAPRPAIDPRALAPRARIALARWESARGALASQAETVRALPWRPLEERALRFAALESREAHARGRLRAVLRELPPSREVLALLGLVLRDDACSAFVDAHLVCDARGGRGCPELTLAIEPALAVWSRLEGDDALAAHVRALAALLLVEAGEHDRARPLLDRALASPAIPPEIAAHLRYHRAVIDADEDAARAALREILPPR